jgi:hypothetical protein
MLSTMAAPETPAGEWPITLPEAHQALQIDAP